jgi:hypothetical protein
MQLITNRASATAAEMESAPATRSNRRKHCRYGFVTDLSYRVIRTQTPLLGRGRTVDMSASGLNVELDRDLPIGARLEITMNWPGVYHGVERTRLTLSARVVRCADSRAALKIYSSQFRPTAIPRVA